jgi:hypothetical protein
MPVASCIAPRPRSRLDLASVDHAQSARTLRRWCKSFECIDPTFCLFQGCRCGLLAGGEVAIEASCLASPTGLSGFNNHIRAMPGPIRLSYGGHVDPSLLIVFHGHLPCSQAKCRISLPLIG